MFRIILIDINYSDRSYKEYFLWRADISASHGFRVRYAKKYLERVFIKKIKKVK